MAFTPQFLDQLKARVGLVATISKRVKLTRKGHEHQGLCPFHKEKTPSFTVNEDKGFYHCFGCQANGSVIDFVMETDGLSFPEAVERLAHDAGMEVPQDTPEQREREKRRQTLGDVTEAAAAFFEKILHMPEGQKGMAYFKDRGLDNQTITNYRLGYAPEGYGGLKTALAREGISEELMVTAGLLIRPDSGREPYDRFRGRVMFPITDRRGQVIAFGGRILGDGTPKYLNSPETPLFHKGSVLYGLDKATPLARRADTLIVTEGYMDVIALARAGYGYAVAPLGTALTEEQIQLLWKVVKEPVLCFDGDNAGQRAAGKAAERALSLVTPGQGLRFATLPTGEDPDSLIRHQGPDVFKKVIASAIPLSEVLWQMASGGHLPDSPEKRASLQQTLDGYTSKISDPTLRKHFSSAFRERLWPRRDTQGSWGKHGKSRKPAGFVNTQAGPAARIDPRRLGENILLATLINNPGLYDDISEDLGTVCFDSVNLDKIRQEVLKTLAENPGLETGDITDHLNKCGFADVASRLLSASIYDHAYFARTGTDPGEAVKGWRQTLSQHKKNTLLTEIKEAEKNFADNPTDEASHRLLILKQQQIETAAEDADLDGSTF